MYNTERHKALENNTYTIIHDKLHARELMDPLSKTFKKFRNFQNIETKLETTLKVMSTYFRRNALKPKPQALSTATHTKHKENSSCGKAKCCNMSTYQNTWELLRIGHSPTKIWLNARKKQKLAGSK